MKETKLGSKAVRLGARIEEVPTAQISMGDRFRQDYGNLKELACSLNERGQLQNLIVQTAEDGKYLLLAGGRRLRAIQELGWETCLCMVVERPLSPLELAEIEWEENAMRKNFGWEEETALKKRILELRQEKDGIKLTSMSDGVSLNAVAAELDISPATLSLDVRLAKAVEAMPEIFSGCKTKAEARRVLNKVGEAVLRGELASRVKQRMGEGQDKLKNLVDRYLICDFFSGVKNVEDCTIDFVEIDPPYAIALQESKMNYEFSYNPDDYNEISIRDYIQFLRATLKECYRTMTNNSWGIIWFGPEPWAETVYNLITEQGFFTTRLTGKWIKPTGQCKRPEKYLANACEEFYYFSKGEPTIIRQGRTNIFSYSPVPAAKKVHPTERPIELMMEILSTFCWEGATIMIPFLGSGKTILAAYRMKMNAFGYEISDAFKDSFMIQAGELLQDGTENSSV